MNEWVWSIDGMILTGKAKVFKETPVSMSFRPPQIPPY